MTVFFFLAAFFSEIIGTLAGFGSSTVFLPLALLFLDFRTALVLVALFHTFGTLGRVGFFGRSLDRRVFVYFGLSSIGATIVGAFLVPLTPQNVLKGILGVFLVGYVLFSFFHRRFRLRPSGDVMVAGGGLSGFLAGLIGTGGALRGAFLTAFHLPKASYIATASAIGLAVDVTRIPVYVAQGFLSPTYYWYIPMLFAVALIGVYVGKHIVDHIQQDRFRTVVLVALLLIGIKFIFDGFFR